MSRSDACARVVDDPPDQVAGAHARALDENGAGLELRQVEKLLHQVTQPPDLPQEIFEDLLIGHLDPFDEVLESRLQRADRRSQLM
ncbi:hypothetical protein BH18ACT13_BH18ACT13_11690 [soil metagenome]